LVGQGILVRAHRDDNIFFSRLRIAAETDGQFRHESSRCWTIPVCLIRGPGVLLTLAWRRTSFPPPTTRSRCGKHRRGPEAAPSTRFGHLPPRQFPGDTAPATGDAGEAGPDGQGPKTSRRAVRTEAGSAPP